MPFKKVLNSIKRRFKRRRGKRNMLKKSEKLRTEVEAEINVGEGALEQFRRLKKIINNAPEDLRRLREMREKLKGEQGRKAKRERQYLEYEIKELKQLLNKGKGEFG